MFEKEVPLFFLILKGHCFLLIFDLRNIERAMVFPPFSHNTQCYVMDVFSSQKRDMGLTGVRKGNLGFFQIVVLLQRSHSEEIEHFI